MQKITFIFILAFLILACVFAFCFAVMLGYKATSDQCGAAAILGFGSLILAVSTAINKDSK